MKIDYSEWSLERCLDDLENLVRMEKYNQGCNQTIAERRAERNNLRGYILQHFQHVGGPTLADSRNYAKLEAAKESARYLVEDICSDHCDLDPEDNQQMAHCEWCNLGVEILQKLRAVVKDYAPETSASESVTEGNRPDPSQPPPPVVPPVEAPKAAVIGFPSVPPYNILNQPLTWLYTHCRAIGMTERADSPSAEGDICLFTMKLKARAEKAERELEAMRAPKEGPSHG